MPQQNESTYDKNGMYNRLREAFLTHVPGEFPKYRDPPIHIGVDVAGGKPEFTYYDEAAIIPERVWDDVALRMGPPPNEGKIENRCSKCGRHL